MKLECSNFCNMQCKMIGANYKEMYSILSQLLDLSGIQKSRKGQKNKTKGGQKHKIDNIEENNEVGVLKHLQNVV